MVSLPFPQTFLADDSPVLLRMTKPFVLDMGTMLQCHDHTMLTFLTYTYVNTLSV